MKRVIYKPGKNKKIDKTIANACKTKDKLVAKMKKLHQEIEANGENAWKVLKKEMLKDGLLTREDYDKGSCSFDDTGVIEYTPHSDTQIDFGQMLAKIFEGPKKKEEPKAEA